MLNEIDLSRADLNLLVLFEAVMRERHVGRAAQRLNLSPSAISHGLSRLRTLLDDPLFLRTPRGMVPTDRAQELDPAIAEILGAVRGVIATAEPFDPLTSNRRFRVGLGDAFLCVHGPTLAARMAALAPGIGLATLHIVPAIRQTADATAWDHVLAMLDNRELDAALLPWVTAPARFATRQVNQEDRLVAATRAAHPYALAPSLDSYCAARHLIVSIQGDPKGVADAELAKKGRKRDVVMTAPNFSAALFLAAESDLLVSLPQSLVAAYGQRFGLVATPLPFDVPFRPVQVVTTEAALRDAGVAWLVDLLVAIMSGPLGP